MVTALDRARLARRELRTGSQLAIFCLMRGGKNGTTKPLRCASQWRSIVDRTF